MSAKEPDYAICTAPNCRRGNTKDEYDKGKCWRCGFDKFELIVAPKTSPETVSLFGSCGYCNSPLLSVGWCSNQDCPYSQGKWVGSQVGSGWTSSVTGGVSYKTASGINIVINGTVASDSIERIRKHVAEYLKRKHGVEGK